MKYRFHIVDVLSSTPFGGNQLTVLPNDAVTRVLLREKEVRKTLATFVEEPLWKI